MFKHCETASQRFGKVQNSLSCFSEYYWFTKPQSVIMIRIFARILYELMLLANYPQKVILCVSSEQAFKKLPKKVYIAILCLNCNFRRFQFCGHQNMPVQMTPAVQFSKRNIYSGTWEFFCLLFPAVTVGYHWLPNGSALYFSSKSHSGNDWSPVVTNGDRWKPINKKLLQSKLLRLESHV